MLFVCLHGISGGTFSAINAQLMLSSNWCINEQGNAFCLIIHYLLMFLQNQLFYLSLGLFKINFISLLPRRFFRNAFHAVIQILTVRFIGSF